MNMEFDLYVGGEFIGTFKCPYDVNRTLKENILITRNSFVFMFGCPVSKIGLGHVQVKRSNAVFDKNRKAVRHD